MPPAPPTQQQLRDFEYIVVTALVLVSWELLVHLFQDLSYLRMKGWYKRPVIWAYFLQRYGAFTVIVAQSNIRLGHPSSCYAAGMVSLTVGGVIVLPAISLIYLYRVLAIWNKRSVVKWVLIALWVVLLGASITAPFSQEARNLPNGTCTIARSEKYTPASFIANAVYDGVVFILTVVKLIANRQQYKNFRSPVQTILLRDGILYFGVAVATGITDIVFLEVVKSPVVASMVIPIHIGLNSVMTTRLVNNVFQVVSEGTTVRNISNSNVPSGPSGGTAAGSFGASGKNTGKSSVMIIGSGVGTDYFDELETTTAPSYDMQGKPTNIHSYGNRTYSVPMQPMQVRVTSSHERLPV
ncbi:hypothetical protein L218DRAFT_973238 [Marasmius fiardii PR-910]|nr:hypothetical protein L218DRAFT_973238 [Marasmius fiardii PR-910]